MSADIIGKLLLILGSIASSLVLLVAYRLHERHQTFDNALLLCFTLGHTYGVLTLLVGGVLPLRLVYQRPDLLEMMHRSRYLIFDCFSMPSIMWILVLLVHRRHEDLGFPAGAATLLDESYRWPVFGFLGLVHIGLAGGAALDMNKCPVVTDNCLSIAYWRPARFSGRMRMPWLVMFGHSPPGILWFAGLCFLVMLRSPWLLLASILFRIAFDGHIQSYKYNTWEIYLQPFAAVALSLAFMQAFKIALHCDWQSMNLGHCIIGSPKGAVPLFGARRF